VEVLTGAEGLDEPFVSREVRHDPHLDLAVVGRHQRLVPLTDDEDVADAAPSSVRIGTFCRFGSVELSRPVAAIVWM
jgi:hypothetical protein